MRAWAAVSQQIAGSFQISGNCRRGIGYGAWRAPALGLRPCPVRISGAYASWCFDFRIARPWRPAREPPSAAFIGVPQPHASMPIKHHQARSLLAAPLPDFWKNARYSRTLDLVSPRTGMLPPRFRER